MGGFNKTYLKLFKKFGGIVVGVESFVNKSFIIIANQASKVITELGDIGSKKARNWGVGIRQYYRKAKHSFEPYKAMYRDISFEEIIDDLLVAPLWQVKGFRQYLADTGFLRDAATGEGYTKFVEVLELVQDLVEERDAFPEGQIPLGSDYAKDQNGNWIRKPVEKYQPSVEFFKNNAIALPGDKVCLKKEHNSIPKGAIGHILSYNVVRNFRGTRCIQYDVSFDLYETKEKEVVIGEVGVFVDEIEEYSIPMESLKLIARWNPETKSYDKENLEDVPAERKNYKLPVENFFEEKIFPRTKD